MSYPNPAPAPYGQTGDNYSKYEGQAPTVIVTGQPLSGANAPPPMAYHQEPPTSTTIQFQPANQVYLPAVNFKLLPELGDDPVRMVCPSCRQNIQTNVAHSMTGGSWLMAAGLCFVSCCCLPFCCTGCQGAKHICPNCGTYVGKKTFIVD